MSTLTLKTDELRAHDGSGLIVINSDTQQAIGRSLQDLVNSTGFQTKLRSKLTSGETVSSIKLSQSGVISVRTNSSRTLEIDRVVDVANESFTKISRSAPGFTPPMPPAHVMPSAPMGSTPFYPTPYPTPAAPSYGAPAVGFPYGPASTPPGTLYPPAPVGYTSVPSIPGAPITDGFITVPATPAGTATSSETTLLKKALREKYDLDTAHLGTLNNLRREQIRLCEIEIDNINRELRSYSIPASGDDDNAPHPLGSLLAPITAPLKSVFCKTRYNELLALRAEKESEVKNLNKLIEADEILIDSEARERQIRRDIALLQIQDSTLRADLSNQPKGNPARNETLKKLSKILAELHTKLGDLGKDCSIEEYTNFLKITHEHHKIACELDPNTKKQCSTYVSIDSLEQEIEELNKAFKDKLTERTEDDRNLKQIFLADDNAAELRDILSELYEVKMKLFDAQRA